MATILLLSGPNLNLFGERDPAVYGTATLAECVDDAREVVRAHGHELEHVQSNHEGDLVDAVQGARRRCAALILNPGALGHYSYALADALATYDGVAVELHVSNPAARRGVAPHLGRGAGRHRHRGGVRSGRLPPRRRGRGRRPRRPGGGVVTAPFPAMDVAGRAPRLRARFADAGIDALLITRLPNVRYLTGFSGSAALLLVTADALLVVTDGRYQTQVGEQLRAAGVDAQVEIGATHADQHAALTRARRAWPASGWRRTASRGPSSAPSPGGSHPRSSPPRRWSRRTAP